VLNLEADQEETLPRQTVTLICCSPEGEKEKVTRIELDEFLLSLPEEKGKKADFRWIKRNKHLIKRHIEENGPNFYTLTSLGKRILRLSRINE
jgi:hypothetical protein